MSAISIVSPIVLIPECPPLRMDIELSTYLIARYCGTTSVPPSVSVTWCPAGDCITHARCHHPRGPPSPYSEGTYGGQFGVCSTGLPSGVSGVSRPAPSRLPCSLYAGYQRRNQQKSIVGTKQAVDNFKCPYLPLRATTERHPSKPLHT